MAGGERSWISAAVNLSMTFIGPPHFGQRQRSDESLHRDVGDEPFVADEIVVVVPSKHEWVGQQVEVQQLCKAPLILREKGSGTRRVVEAALRAAGIQMKHTRVIMELDSTEAIKSAVEAGLGVGFVSRRAIQKEVKLDTLREAHTYQIWHSTNFRDYLPHGPEPRGAAGVFLRFLREKRDRRKGPTTTTKKEE